MPLLAALPAGRYVVRAEGSGSGAALVAECVEAGAACAAWSAVAPVLGCGGSAAGRFDGGAAGARVRAPSTSRSAARPPTAARRCSSSCAFRARRACSSTRADRSRTRASGCTTAARSGPTPRRSASTETRASRARAAAAAATAAAERAQYGYAAVVTAELAAGDYWVRVDSDRPPARQAEPESASARELRRRGAAAPAELCASVDRLRGVHGADALWVVSFRAACLTGTADAALMDVCDAWDPFGLECDASAAALGDEDPRRLKAALPLVATLLVFAAAARSQRAPEPRGYVARVVRNT